MESFYSLYDHLIKAAVNKKVDEEIKKLTNFNPHHLDCLLISTLYNIDLGGENQLY
ncbi:MAG: hypothetical protein PHT02_09260 [Tissierellia bacterium]|nr:hypothetical protein [Tissierellia bacterium]